MRIKALRKHPADLVLEPETWRLPDRGKGYFGQGRTTELSPPGRPNDIYGDVLVTLSRIRAMEVRNA
jgi:hypothetical protein